MATAAAPPTLLATRRGKLTLALLAAVAFLDFVDASIVNIALPSIRRDLHFSEQGLQWVTSGYLLTYGGFMLLGGRAADLLGRRRVLVAGVVLIGGASLVGGFAGSSGLLVAARLAQGIGAAFSLPAALSILTTTFQEGSDRNTALGIWGAVAGLASAAGVLLGGFLTEGPGWRWVMFVNPIAAAVVLVGVFRLIDGERPEPQRRSFDVAGAILATAGMLLLVFTLVEAPDQGWGDGRTILGLAGALALLAGFAINEHRAKKPLLPLSIFRVKGLAAADATQLIASAGVLAMFFFLTLYMQNVLGYSPIQAGASYLPLTFGIGLAAGVSSQLLERVGTRPVSIAGSLIAAGGVLWLSRIPVDGSYVSDLLPGMFIMSLGLGAVFVAVTTAANAGVPADRAGLAAALVNASTQVGGALGLAIFSAIATTRINDLLESHAQPATALTSGFQRALLACSVFLLAAAVIATRITNTRGETTTEGSPMPAPPTFGAPVIGQTEKALSAILERQLSGTDLNQPAWIALSVSVAAGGPVDRDELTQRVAGALKVSPAEARAHLTTLADARLLESGGSGSLVEVSEAGRQLHGRVRAAITEVTDRLWGDLPVGDLATAGHVLGTVLERANAELEPV
ncbi:MAG TPA: MFS transporter [Thermoleophilaceae bacterium]|jgi:EmrB/QacA subfamily drug resistance transporter